MHILLAQLLATDAWLDAQSGPLALWGNVWPYLAMLAGFSVIIFVHELGHFLVAKWAGVRVEKFAIGFGRELFGASRGETRYSFNILPLGGYVKMLGQEDFDDKSKELRFKDDPRSFVNKPVGHRMAIVSAGVIMNILFACLLFMVVFLIGLESVAPRIATVEADSSADKAGLLPGDQIREINGERILDFNQASFAVLLAPPYRPIEFVVERADGLHTIAVTPEMRQPKGTRDPRRLMVGISSGLTREIIAIGPEIDTSTPDVPRIHDILVEVDGIEVTDANASEIYSVLPYAKGSIYVERVDPDDPDAKPRRVKVNIPPLLAVYPSNSKDPESVGVLGLTPLVRFGLVREKSRASLAGIEVGDTVLSWADIPFPNQAEIARAIRDYPERDIPFTVRKADGRTVDGFVRPKRNKRGPATIQARCTAIDPTNESEGGPKACFTDVRQFGRAYAEGIRAGDMVLYCNGRANPVSNVVNRLVSENVGRTLAFAIRKADGVTHTVFVEPEAPGSINSRYNLIAADFLQIGNIVPTIDGRPSPAARAGIPSGVQIAAVNGKPVSTWPELIESFQSNAGTQIDLAYVDQANKRHVVPFHVPHCLRTLLGVGPEARIVRIDNRETVIMGSRQEKVTVQYHEGTRAMLTELIGRKQVPIEYRENPLSELRTAYIDIAEGMVDPWLGRIAFAPNIFLGSETILLKGENAFDAVVIGMYKTYYFIRQVYEMLHRMIFTRSVGVENIAGPLGIVSLGGKVARAGLPEFLFFMAIISANLAVINFLPLPIVDGGLMVFLIIEKIKGSPVSLRVQIATQMLGLFLIIGAFLFVTYQDVLRLAG